MVLGLVLVLWLGASGCGPVSRPKPPRPALPRTRLTVTLAGSPLLALPLFVAEHAHLLREYGLSIRLAADGPIYIGPPAAFPLDGLVAWRPDAVVLTPGPDAPFRWTDLKAWPKLPVAALDQSESAWLAAVLADHGLAGIPLERFSLPDALRLLAHHHLPWLVLPLVKAQGLLARGAYAAGFVGASTGPVPALVVEGHGAGLERLLAALNQADSLIASTPAATLAKMTARAYPGLARAVLTTLIATGQGLGLWPPASFLGRDVYERGRHLRILAGIAWPDYSAGVKSAPELQALIDPRP